MLVSVWFGLYHFTLYTQSLVLGYISSYVIGLANGVYKMIPMQRDELCMVEDP
jgi:hypothetical protein